MFWCNDSQTSGDYKEFPDTPNKIAGSVLSQNEIYIKGQSLVICILNIVLSISQECDGNATLRAMLHTY